MAQLTRMHLNPRRRQTIRFQRDPQAMHAAVESSFPPGTNEGRTLWRLDDDGPETKLLIVSERAPSLEHLQEQAGWGNERTWETRPYDPLLTRLAKGQQYQFRLTANPASVKTSPSGVKKRLAHVSVGYQLLWLAKRAEQIGVRFLDREGRTIPSPGEDAPPPGGLDSVLVSNRETSKFHRGNQQITIARARFEGTLQVDDVDSLRASLVGGVGRAKAYGCGLLTLAPLRASAIVEVTA